jgi:hypothetical protein
MTAQVGEYIGLLPMRQLYVFKFRYVYCCISTYIYFGVGQYYSCIYTSTYRTMINVPPGRVVGAGSWWVGARARSRLQQLWYIMKKHCGSLEFSLNQPKFVLVLHLVPGVPPHTPDTHMKLCLRINIYAVAYVRQTFELPNSPYSF